MGSILTRQIATSGEVRAEDIGTRIATQVAMGEWWEEETDILSEDTYRTWRTVWCGSS